MPCLWFWSWSISLPRGRGSGKKLRASRAASQLQLRLAPLHCAAQRKASSPRPGSCANASVSGVANACRPAPERQGMKCGAAKRPCYTKSNRGNKRVREREKRRERPLKAPLCNLTPPRCAKAFLTSRTASVERRPPCTPRSTATIAGCAGPRPIGCLPR